jgi:CDP-glucose 4,6-dehydratase
VFVTGHTGFKGGWLSLWLHEIGAQVFGYALAPPTEPNLFTLVRVGSVVGHEIGDIRDFSALSKAMHAFAPDIVFHLAAQPLVRESYRIPLDTFATNVMGTLHVLEAIRLTPSVETGIIVTSDKVYAESQTSRHGEDSRLGGHDPYSASKACAELATASFPIGRAKKIATVRSGNVIGGGDWAADRLVADFIRAIMAGETLAVRNPDAVRPWQHVLDPLCGYLLAAEHLCNHTARPVQSWNFGPAENSEITVRELAVRLCEGWGDGAGFDIVPQLGAPHEAPVLRLNSAKAGSELNWQPGLTIDAALAQTIAWFKAYAAGENMAAFTIGQIQAYQNQVFAHAS